MRVTFLTQYYPPEMGAPQARLSEFARGLAERGWEVSVVTAFPNYPAGRISPEYRGRWYLREVRDGTTVRRTWIRPDASVRVSARLAAACSFAVSASLTCLLFHRRSDILFVESPPLTMGVAGAIVSRLTRCPHVLNISDLWPRSLVEMDVLRSDRLIRAASRAEAMAYRSADLITAQSPDIVWDIKERFAGRDVRLLSNGVDTQRFGPELRSEALRRSLGGDDAILVTYAGLHGLAQGLDAVLEAAHRLRDQRSIQFRLVGDGPAKAGLLRKAEQLKLENVRFLEPTARDQVAALLASSDVALVTLSRALLGAIPSKVYEAMASGVPVLAATGGGAAAIVSKGGAGLSVQPGNGAEIASAIDRLAADPLLRARCGAAGRQLACQQYDRRLWIDRLAEYLQSLAPRQVRSRERIVLPTPPSRRKKA